MISQLAIFVFLSLSLSISCFHGSCVSFFASLSVNAAKRALKRLGGQDKFAVAKQLPVLCLSLLLSFFSSSSSFFGFVKLIPRSPRRVAEVHALTKMPPLQRKCALQP